MPIVAGFFDAIDHDWLIKFLELRIGDRPRSSPDFASGFNAGIMEEGQWSATTVGSAARGGDFTLVGERVSSLRVRPVDRLVAGDTICCRDVGCSTFTRTTS